ncbi:(+)-neomenthol dehydrogenase-like [Quercus lobata]|uniref:(+)-neomenthol dehydrogenase-like n=1 Tax=Quercus lobata TaxID=97700 RepID=UPI00124942AC|nr:(+)-neomenthol dehydrogenase-like [Quercus lobata]
MQEGANVDWSKIVTDTYELAEECLKTNYYGAKGMIEALLPILQLSNSPRIVNVSSSMGRLKHIPNEWAKEVLGSAESLTEERVDEVLNEHLKDFKEGSLETKGWPRYSSAYIISKAAMNAYTRIVAKKFPSFQVNCVCPGYVKTDINYNNGYLTTDEGAESVVKLALLPNDGPSGLFFFRNEVTTFNSMQVNNAGIYGTILDGDALAASGLGKDEEGANVDVDWSKILTDTYELAEECLKINYNGAKGMIEALLPILQLSNSPRIVNVSSSLGHLKEIPSEWAKEVLANAESLTEERVDEVLNEYLKDFKEGSLETKGWPRYSSAYVLSKATLNACTRIVAKKFPSFRVNCVCPGYVKSDFNHNTGYLTTDEGAESVVKLALLPNDGPSGLFFSRNEVTTFD